MSAALTHASEGLLTVTMTRKVLFLTLGLLAGCATHDSKNSASQPGNGVEEYRQLTSESAVAVQGALRWLEQVSAQSGRCSGTVVAGFADEVDKLQVESIRVRARAQAVQARGEKYLETWAAIGQPTEPQVAPPSEKLSQLRDAFVRIKEASSDVGLAFRPFFSALRKLRAGLETDPALVGTDETRALIRTTREQGWQVLQKLRVLRDELQAFQPVLSRVKPVSGTL